MKNLVMIEDNTIWSRLHAKAHLPKELLNLVGPGRLHECLAESCCFSGHFMNYGVWYIIYGTWFMVYVMKLPLNSHNSDTISFITYPYYGDLN